MTTYEYEWQRLKFPHKKEDARSRFVIESEFFTKMGKQGWRVIDRQYWHDSVDVLFERRKDG